MNELEKIIEGFKKAKEACEELHKVATLPSGKGYWLGKANAFEEVIKILESLLADNSIFVVNVEKTAQSIAMGIQKLTSDLEGKGGN